MTQEILFWAILNLCKNHNPVEICEIKIRSCYMRHIELNRSEDEQRLLSECYLRIYSGEI